ncbi:MAG: zinc-binding dehydrogenase [Chloroflexi bacterium]|nr:zinc-binding dehydrogenase [Chloroflexota bacterium]
MKAAILYHPTLPEKLTAGETEMPRPQAGQVRVRIEAAALNHRDVFICRGQYSGLRFPVILGADGVGIIDIVGEGVSSKHIGQKVIINPALEWGDDARLPGPHFRILGMPDDGTFAEAVCVPEKSVYPVPGHLTSEEAAALPLAGLTAYRALFTRARLKARERLVITGVGGGVAAAALQLSIVAGATVAVTSGHDFKLERARQLGAAEAVSYRSDDWVHKLREWSGGSGPDVVLDGAGGGSLEAAIDLVRPGGRVVLYGATLGNVPALTARRIFWKQLDVLGSTMGSPEDFEQLLGLVGAHQIRPEVDASFALEDIGSALHRLDTGLQFGKIVIHTKDSR